MSNDPNCVFCKIASAQIPSSIVFEDESTVAFLDVNPLADGHLLVIPREHYGRFYEMPANICSKLVAVLPSLGRALLDVSGADGYNVLLNDGSVAGQVVAHVHFHLIPRRANDDLGYRWNPSEYPEGRAAEIATEYQEALTHHIDS